MKRLLVFALLALAIVSLTGCSLRTAGSPKGSLTVVATFDDVQTLVVGHSVQVADVAIGTVTELELEGYRAKATMSIVDGYRIPRGTTATIARTSLLGESYVRLDPPPGQGLDQGPFLRDGEAITDTQVQADFEMISEKALPLITALNAQHLGHLIDAADQAFGGKGRDLNRLIDTAADLASSYGASRRDLETIIDGMARIGREFRAGTPGFDRLLRRATIALEALAQNRRPLIRTIRDLTGLAEDANRRVFGPHTQELRRSVERMSRITATLADNGAGLTAVLKQTLRFLETAADIIDPVYGIALYGWLMFPEESPIQPPPIQVPQIPGLPDPSDPLDSLPLPQLPLPDPQIPLLQQLLGLGGRQR